MRYLLPLLLPLLLCACPGPQTVQREAYVFGTRVELVSLGSEPRRDTAALAEVLREFDRIHRQYHAWQASPLTTLNAACQSGEPQAIDAELAALLRRSQDYAARSEGLFEPGIGALIAAWGFHSDSASARLPAPTDTERLLARNPGVRDIHITNGEARCTNPATALDLGGIAKGWALDRAAVILRREGVKNALINIGGNVMALGQKGDVPWRVGIQDPRGSGAIATLTLSDGEAIGTSGDYQRFFELDGQRYSHLIDPRTGRPAQHTRAVTVLIPGGTEAGLRSDVTSKPIFIAGEQWRHMATRMGVDHVLRIDSDGRIAVTRKMLARLRFSGDAKADVVVD